MSFADRYDATREGNRTEKATSGGNSDIDESEDNVAP